MDHIESAGKHQFAGSLLMAVLITFLLGCTVVAPAPQAPKVAQIGFLSLARPGPSTEAFFDGMRELGWVEGHNLTIEWRVAELDSRRLPALARELVDHEPDALFANGEAAAQALLEATGEIPIVMVT